MGLPRDATEAEIRQAYRRLALAHHPDICRDDPRSAERFKTLSRAYALLTDVEQRERYDSGLASSSSPPLASPGDGSLGGLLDAVFGYKDTRVRRGTDSRYSLRITFSEMALGVTKALRIPRVVACDSCQGRGFPVGSTPLICDRCVGAGATVIRKALRSEIERCGLCRGRGYVCPVDCADCGGVGTVQATQEVSFKVPAGVPDQKEFVLKGMGQPAAADGPPGDLWVRVSVSPDPHMRRDGFNILVERPISVLKAFIGGKLRIPTPEGPISVGLPPRVHDGLVMRLKGHGISNPKTGARGDLKIRVAIEMPTAVDEVTRASVEAILESVEPGVFPASDAFEREVAAALDAPSPKTDRDTQQ